VKKKESKIRKKRKGNKKIKEIKKISQKEIIKKRKKTAAQLTCHRDLRDDGGARQHSSYRWSSAWAKASSKRSKYKVISPIHKDVHVKHSAGNYRREDR
jgi:hypothetical protein